MLTPTSRVKRCWRYEAASPTFFANSRVRNNGWLCNKWTTCFTRGSRVVIPRFRQFCVSPSASRVHGKKPLLTKEDEKTRRQHAKQREKFRIDAGSPPADEPKACRERAVLASAEHQEIRSVDIVDHRIVIIVARGAD